MLYFQINHKQEILSKLLNKIRVPVIRFLSSQEHLCFKNNQTVFIYNINSQL